MSENPFVDGLPRDAQLEASLKKHLHEEPEKARIIYLRVSPRMSLYELLREVLR